MTTTGTTRRARWFTTAGADPNADHQVFLFPHAGGTAPAYQSWAATLPSTMEVRTLQLPGRQERLGETPFTEVEPLLDALLEAFEAELDGRPYVLFGHSFGGLLAYRLAVAAAWNGLPAPALLAVSAWAPGLEPAAELARVSSMSDAELLARVRQLGLMAEGATLDPATLASISPRCAATSWSPAVCARTANRRPARSPRTAGPWTRSRRPPVWPPGRTTARTSSARPRSPTATSTSSSTPRRSSTA